MVFLPSQQNVEFSSMYRVASFAARAVFTLDGKPLTICGVNNLILFWPSEPFVSSPHVNSLPLMSTAVACYSPTDIFKMLEVINLREFNKILYSGRSIKIKCLIVPKDTCSCFITSPAVHHTVTCQKQDSISWTRHRNKLRWLCESHFLECLHTFKICEHTCE